MSEGMSERRRRDRETPLPPGVWVIGDDEPEQPDDN
jgi:hypothetical protein